MSVAFHPGGVLGTKIADTAPEWLRKNFKDTRESPKLFPDGLLNAHFA